MTLGTYIHKVFTKCKENEDVYDLLIANAMVVAESELPEGWNEAKINRFISKHYNELCDNFANMNINDFAVAIQNMYLDDLDDEKRND